MMPVTDDYRIDLVELFSRQDVCNQLGLLRQGVIQTATMDRVETSCEIEVFQDPLGENLRLGSRHEES